MDSYWVGAVPNLKFSIFFKSSPVNSKLQDFAAFGFGHWACNPGAIRSMEPRVKLPDSSL